MWPSRTRIILGCGPKRCPRRGRRRRHAGGRAPPKENEGGREIFLNGLKKEKFGGGVALVGDGVLAKRGFLFFRARDGFPPPFRWVPIWPAATARRASR